MDSAAPESVTLADLLADLQRILAARDRQWFTVSGAADYSSLSAESIRRLLSSGKLTAHRPCKGRILISRDELDGLIRTSTVQPRVGRGHRHK